MTLLDSFKTLNHPSRAKQIHIGKKKNHHHLPLHSLSTWPLLSSDIIFSLTLSMRRRSFSFHGLIVFPILFPFSSFAAPCFVEEVDGIYEDGEIFEVDDCTTCACNDGEVLCQTEQCKQPNCLNPITKAGECCPACPDEVRREG